MIASKRKGFVFFVWMLLAVVLTFMVLPISTYATNQSQDIFDEFENFRLGYIQMMRDFPLEDAVLDDAAEDAACEVILASTQHNTNPVAGTRHNRLIVYSQNSIDGFGEVAKAECNGWHFFQYASKAEADSAFESFKALGLDVSYDTVVSIEDESFQSQTQKILGTSSKEVLTYNSWGGDYVGWSEYTTNMLRLNDEKNLNEIIIAVLDSGINTKHSLFKGRIVTDENGNLFGQDFTGETTQTGYAFEDLNGHGSHVSGTIAEATLSNVKILPLKVLDRDGRGNTGMIVSALNFLNLFKNGSSSKNIEAHPNVVGLNMSIGLDVQLDADGNLYASNSAVTKAFGEVYQNNILPFIAAGNEAGDIENVTPANIPEAIVVSALMLAHSNKGDTVTFAEGYSNYGRFIDFCAPGTDILSAYGGRDAVEGFDRYQYKSGTSMATPHVCACYALLCSNPVVLDFGEDGFTKEKMQAMEKYLQDNAVDYGAEGWDKKYGYGCINIAGIGMNYSGEVNFVQDKSFVDEAFPTSSFNLTLSYDAPNGASTDIYYTLENNSGSSLTNGKTEFLYDGRAINISQTTKVSAYAFIKDTSGKTIQKSFVSEKTYYFDNIDLDSNFVFGDAVGSTQLSSYKGILTTLKVPEMISRKYPRTILSNAFSNSKVEVLYLPTATTSISNYAFSGSSIVEIHSSSTEVNLGNFAFQDCKNLTTFDIPYVARVGEGAFRGCTSLEELKLMRARNISRQAFVDSGIKNLYIGKNATIVGDQTGFDVQNVYGYASQSEDVIADSQQLAYDNNAEFVDLSLKIIKNLNATMIINDSTATISFAYSGYGATATLYMAKPSNSWQRQELGDVTQKSVEGEPFSTEISFTLRDILNGTHIRFDLYDFYGSESNVLSSQVMCIDVVSASANKTFEISFSGEHINAYINSFSLGEQGVFYKTEKHTLHLVAENGYRIASVTINGNSVGKVDGSEFECDLQSQDQVIVATAVLKEVLSISFVNRNGNADFVRLIGQDEQKLAGNVDTVDVGQDYVFKIVPTDDLAVSRVIANGKVLVAEDGWFKISSVDVDYQIVVMFEEKLFKLSVTLGKGGNLTVDGSSEYARYGSKKEYRISVNSGYALDSVTINGVKVAVAGGQSFVIPIENITQDFDIVVSFRKVNTSLIAGTDFMLYFFIFLFITIVFIVAKIILTIIRKKEKEDEERQSR